MDPVFMGGGIRAIGQYRGIWFKHVALDRKLGWDHVVICCVMICEQLLPGSLTTPY